MPTDNDIRHLAVAIRNLDARLRKLENRETALSPWLEPGLLNSWADTGGAYATAAYWKDPAGTVHLKGTIDSGTPPSTAFTLIAGYRPGATIAFAVPDGAMVEISTAGAVVVAATGGSVSLDGITFRADA